MFLVEVKIYALLVYYYCSSGQESGKDREESPQTFWTHSEQETVRN
jgi:hypothetical protein